MAQLDDAFFCLVRTCYKKASRVLTDDLDDRAKDRPKKNREKKDCTVL